MNGPPEEGSADRPDGGGAGADLSHRFRAEAEAELLEITAWYEGERAGLGWAFFDAVRAAVVRATEAPSACARVPVRAPCTVRWTPVRRFPYRLVFLHEADEVVVLAIAHHRRHPRYWLDRA